MSSSTTNDGLALTRLGLMPDDEYSALEGGRLPEAEARLRRAIAGPVMRVASADDYDADFGENDSGGNG